jgi:hypothetical protein
MDIASFLQRVTAPGNFIAVTYNREPGKKKAAGRSTFSTQFFPSGHYSQAARLIEWASRKGYDAYHAQASFTTAIPDGTDARGNIRYKGERKATNVQNLKSFWIDADIKRAGDGKDPRQCYADAVEFCTWLKAFRATTGMPLPNMVVSSGYGLHVYWILEDAVDLPTWQPYADALKAAMIAARFKGDTGISGDAARLLRPIDTTNNKTQPAAPVYQIPRIAGGDIPNDLVYQALTPYLGQIVRARPATTVVQPSGLNAALASGKVSSIFQGAAAVALPNMTAAAQANLPSAPSTRPHLLSKIAGQCGQVAKSLEEHGEFDEYPIWYQGNLTLAHFCVDGANYVHQFGDGNVNKYSVANTEFHVNQIAQEHIAKNIGPPSCGLYDQKRPGICRTCPFWGKIKGPWNLGSDDGDLPNRYRRHAGAIQGEYYDMKRDKWEWQDIVKGDVLEPHLDWLPSGGHAITFTFEKAGTRRTIYARVQQLVSDSSAIHRIFEPQGVTLLPGRELRFREFVMFLVEKLIEARTIRTENVQPFGWVEKGNTITGFALAGTLYRPGGLMEPAPGADPVLLAMFQPQGQLSDWQTAFDFVTKGRPDLAAVVATSFAAPLIKLTGHFGVVMSAWSRESGRGKSSAMRVGQAVWSSQAMLNSTNDTGNAVMDKVASTRAIVSMWDEARVTGEENVRRFIDTVFQITQGKEKARMNGDSTQRAVRRFETILTVCANRSLMDLAIAESDGTDAGALRIFEFHLDNRPMAPVPGAARTIALADTNYGWAGVAYASWLADHLPTVRKALDIMVDDLTQALKAEQSERLFIALMATILVAAKITTTMKLAVFDYGPLKAFLCKKFLELRAARTNNVVVGTQGYDLEEILSTFFGTHQSGKLVTQFFPQQGRAAKPAVLWTPVNGHTAEIHIGIDDQLMRINRKTFTDYCRKRSLSGPDLINEMATRWNASVGRRVLGGGTGFTTGATWAIDIPLTAPELSSYQITPPQQAAAVPAPKPQGPPTPGNKPRVK